MGGKGLENVEKRGIRSKERQEACGKVFEGQVKMVGLFKSLVRVDGFEIVLYVATRV